MRKLTVRPWDRARFRRRLGWCVALVLVVGVLGWQTWGLQKDRRLDQLHDQAVTVAKAQALDLTTMDSKTVDSKLKSLASRTVGDFKAQFGEITKTFRDLVQKQGISATGAIDGVGVESFTIRRASVLVAASSTITDAKDTKPVVRTYRFRVKLERSGVQWKVRGMEFVQ